MWPALCICGNLLNSMSLPVQMLCIGIHATTSIILNSVLSCVTSIGFRTDLFILLVY